MHVSLLPLLGCALRSILYFWKHINNYREACRNISQWYLNFTGHTKVGKFLISSTMTTIKSTWHYRFLPFYSIPQSQLHHYTYTGSFKDTGPDRHMWIHCGQIPCLVTTALGSEFCCLPACTAHCLAFKMLILLLNDLQTTENSHLARWSWGTAHVCKDYWIQQQAPSQKKLTCSVNGYKFKSFSVALISLNKQKSSFCFMGVLSQISVPVLHSTNMKNPYCYCIKPQNFLLVSQL